MLMLRKYDVGHRHRDTLPRQRHADDLFVWIVAVDQEFTVVGGDIERSEGYGQQDGLTGRNRYTRTDIGRENGR